jgi:adenosylcobinamide-GDP ribazoletransferase
LSNLPTALVPWVLLAAHSVSRFLPLLLMYNYNYSRTEDCKAAGAVYAPNIMELLFSAVLASLPLFLLPVLSCLAIMPILLVNYWLGRYFYRHIGGYTGDCLGTSQQTAEVIFYLSVSSLWTFI